MPIVVFLDPERHCVIAAGVAPSRPCEWHQQARLRAPDACGGPAGLMACSRANYTAWRAANLLDEGISHTTRYHILMDDGRPPDACCRRMGVTRDVADTQREAHHERTDANRRPTGSSRR